MFPHLPRRWRHLRRSYDVQHNARFTARRSAFYSTIRSQENQPWRLAVADVTYRCDRNQPR